MKLDKTLPAVAAALAVFSVSPSTAVRLSGMKEQQHLQPASFASMQSEAQALQQIKDELAAVDDDSAQDSEVQQKIMKALAPSLKMLFESVAKTVRPELKEECDRFIADITQTASDVALRLSCCWGAAVAVAVAVAAVVAAVVAVVAVGNEMEADWGDDSFSELSAEAEVEGQQQERLTAAGFWDKVKKHVGTLASVAAPLIEKVAKKLGPTVEKLGGKIAPTFARYIKLLMRKACEQAEKDAGFEAPPDVDF
ncbi:hypothetical protein Emag_003843 [Eimeria magna]